MSIFIDFFILPPSKSELKRRLIKRGRDNNEEINLRLSYAIDEMKHYNEYKYVLITILLIIIVFPSSFFYFKNQKEDRSIWNFQSITFDKEAGAKASTQKCGKEEGTRGIL